MLLHELFSGFASPRQKGRGFALLRQTTDYRQWTTEGKAGIRNYGTTEATPDNGQQTTDNGQRRAKPAHCSWLVAHGSLPKKYYNITTTLQKE